MEMQPGVVNQDPDQNFKYKTLKGVPGISEK